MAAATALAFLAPLTLRYRIIRAGRSGPRRTGLGRRLGATLGKVLLQRCTLKNERRFTGVMHVFIFYGALTFDTMTVNHALEGFFDGFFLFGQTGFGLLFSLVVDVFAVLVLAGTLFFIVRRFIVRPEAYRTTRLDSALIYAFLIAVTLSYLYFEAYAIALHPETARLSFLGSALADRIAASGSSAAAVIGHFKTSWWLHILLVFGFISYVPHSKYLHMLAGPFNVLLRPERRCGELEALALETSDRFGVEKSADFSWKDNLDAFACMECGRCQDVCPAFISEKPLSPKMLLFKQERRLLAERKLLLAKKGDEGAPLMPGTFEEGEVWSCTTCGACMHVCPVEIEHIAKIVGLRRSRVLMESKFPAELNATFRNMETNSNPWGIGFADRAAWTEDLGIPLIKDEPETDWLYYVGCAGSFDETGKTTSAALASLLKRAGLAFAVLGPEEKCCGDSARRLGNEYLFQQLAAENLAAFLRYGVKRIVTACPHGFNLLKHEYPRLMDTLSAFSEEDKAALRAIEVVHHTELLARLLREGRLKVASSGIEDLTYHDPCYLARHNGITEAPREVLSRLARGGLRKLDRSGEHGFCCGAGGGLMWTEESLGTRVNHLRTDEVLASGAMTVATACPFCKTMLADGLKDKGRTDVAVMDVAQLLAERTA
ncbi:MAG: (Fe-S)-binding protein [Candidatus Aminicenantes bacterium]|nr:(Fe-S)-binding protein [Candidatus Aminicenantes bacterium]